MNGKRNNPSWCCDRIEELIEEYEKKADNSYGIEHEIYTEIVDELKEILYEQINSGFHLVRLGCFKMDKLIQRKLIKKTNYYQKI